MTALTMNQEFGQMRVRFRRTLGLSIGFHVLLLVVLMANRHWAPLDVPVVEITWLEQLSPAPAEEQQIKPAQITQAAPEATPQLTVREKLAARAATTAQVQQKLAALQPSTVMDKAAAGLPRTSDLLNTAQATMAPVVRMTPPTDLNRGTTASEPAVALRRGPTASHRTPAAVAGLPSGSLGGSGAASNDPAAASSAEQHLGGATIKGMVADRKVLSYPMPIYPDWATDQAVEATVTLYFVVLPSGQVKENIQVQKMAGYRDFDRNAIAALSQWRFESLVGQETLQQWGTITFRFRLTD